MRKLLYILAIGLMAGAVLSCSDRNNEPQEEDVHYQCIPRNWKHLTQTQAEERGFVCLDYTRDPVDPIADKDVILVDMSEQTRAEIPLISPAIIEWMQCSRRCNSSFEPDTVYTGREGGEVNGRSFWIFYPQKATMGNISATFSSCEKLVIERTQKRQDYAVYYCLTRFNDIQGFRNISIPEPVYVVVYQTPKGEAIAQDWAIEHNPDK